ncbi:hypothetical protein B296_00029779 [Ensete ventricosum]|uniref:Uncharacterized protein n=1 Tax=Ensete ventricosum TaxID=4639 RepID=A0A427AK96_ENSVE|nr:hypothetical protein B296_00029779 [Ensete ventricosum]
MEFPRFKQNLENPKDSWMRATGFQAVRERKDYGSEKQETIFRDLLRKIEQGWEGQQDLNSHEEFEPPSLPKQESPERTNTNREKKGKRERVGNTGGKKVEWSGPLDLCPNNASSAARGRTWAVCFTIRWAQVVLSRPSMSPTCRDRHRSRIVGPA